MTAHHKVASRHKINFPLDSQPDLNGSAIGRLAQSLYPHDPCRRQFMVLTAYYDESGTHAGSPATVLAGFVGSTNDLVEFEIEWSKVLRKHNLTYPRAKHLFHRQGQHKRWADEQAEHLWNDLMYVFQERKDIFASKTILREDDYKMFYVMDGASRKERLDTRYALCLRAFLHFLPEMAKIGGSTINFILEAGHKNAGDALRVFNEMKADKNLQGRHNMGFLSFGTKPDSPALQAADLLAYMSYTDVCETIEDYPDSTGKYLGEIDLALIGGCGLTILENAIAPEDLKTIRQNFLRKNKKPIFRRAYLNCFPYEIGPESPYAQYAGLRPDRR